LRGNICAVCGGDILLPPTASTGLLETPQITLNCRHSFHEFCIKGWCLIGKKETCPYCRERVDLSQFFHGNPWKNPDFVYGSYLDFARYMIVWLPCLVMMVQFLVYFAGLSK